MKKSVFNNYKDSNMFYVINKLLYKTIGSKCKLLYVSSPGSSPSKVYMFKDESDKMYAVKVCDINISRVSLHKEVENIEFLKPFLEHHLPNIIYIGRYKGLEIMISECFGIDSFFSSFTLNKKPINFYFDIWENVLLEIMKMWKNSKDYNYSSSLNPRNNKARIKRIKSGVLDSKYNGYSLDLLKDLKIEVNGVDYLSLEEIFEEINNISEPKFGVTCHGDPQPSNIIISENNNWYLVDWEWSGKNHDYRLMFSHLYGWWATRLTNLKRTPKFEVKGEKLIISYEIYENSIVNQFQKLSETMLYKDFNISENDLSDINRFLALLYLGDIRFLDIWGRLDYLPVLLGEAVKTVCYIKNKNLPINRTFTIKREGNNE